MFTAEVQRAMNQVNAQGLVLHHAVQSQTARVHFVVVMEYETALKWFQRGYRIGNDASGSSESERRVYAVIKVTRNTVWRYVYRLFKITATAPGDSRLQPSSREEQPSLL